MRGGRVGALVPVVGVAAADAPAAYHDIWCIHLGERKMNKAELVDKVIEATDLNKASASRAVDAVFDSISSALKGGDQVTIVGFGTFSVSSRAERTGRNPQTGESIRIPASKNPKFKAGKGLKDAVN